MHHASAQEENCGKPIMYIVMQYMILHTKRNETIHDDDQKTCSTHGMCVALHVALKVVGLVLRYRARGMFVLHFLTLVIFYVCTCLEEL